jgi:glycosyltransferase involved in cell wall biosynthesis
MKPKYNILHIANLSSLGGVQTIVMNLINKPVKQFQYFVFSPQKINNLWLDKLVNCNVIFADGSSNKDWEKALALFTAKNKIDLAHLHYPWRKAKYELKKSNIKIIIEHDHGASWQRSPFQICKDKIRNDRKLVNGVIAVSDSSYYMLTKRLGYNPQQVKRIYNGINFDQLKVTETIPKPPGKKIVTTISRLVTLKSIDSLIKAIPLIIKKRNDVEFWIVGDGPLRDELERLANQLNVQSHIKFWGNQTNVSNYLAVSDLFVLPTLKEPLGTVLIEAGYFSLPLIATNIDGNSEIIIDDETGILLETKTPLHVQVNKGDPMPYYVIDGSTKELKKPLALNSMELAEAVVNLLSTPERCISLGKNAKNRSLHFFNINRFQSEITNYYLEKLEINNE